MKKIIFLTALLIVFGASSIHAQDTEIIPIPTMPDCETLDVQPEVLIGGNVTISGEKNNG